LSDFDLSAVELSLLLDLCSLRIAVAFDALQAPDLDVERDDVLDADAEHEADDGPAQGDPRLLGCAARPPSCSERDDGPEAGANEPGEVALPPAPPQDRSRIHGARGAAQAGRRVGP
jgi:hypothetical protein